MEISTGNDGRVYVRWYGGGPYAVLHRDGTVTQECGMGGSTQWGEHEEPETDDRGDYDDGFSDGLKAGRELGPVKASDATAGAR